MMSYPNAAWPFPKPEPTKSIGDILEYRSLTVADKKYVCPFCYKEHTSPNGTGTDILCCGELGHCQPTTE